MNKPYPLAPQPVDQLKVFQHRAPLSKTISHLANGQLTLGFLGGSITQDGDFNWPGPLARWFAHSFPHVTTIVENAGRGATGSDSACLRVQREILDQGCHLTFVEYAVNDNARPSEHRCRTREGLLRKLLAAGHDVVLVYTFSQDMYADMSAGVVPASIAEFETLAAHYQLGSVWVGLHAFNEVRAGGMKWGEWLPDGLHPAHRGSWCYAQAVIQFLTRELLQPATTDIAAKPTSLPEPLNVRHWQNASVLPLSSTTRTGPWVFHRTNNNLHTEQVLETHTPGARLAFDFSGTNLSLVFEYGKRSAEFAYRVNGGPWTPVVRTRYDWGGDCGMVQPWTLPDELTPGLHTFELEVMHGNRPDCTGTELRLACIGVH